MAGPTMGRGSRHNTKAGALMQGVRPYQPAPVHLPAVGWLTDATWARVTMALLVFWKSSGFAILIMLAALQAIPQELYEAAAIDGATARVQFWRITLPLLRRTISFFIIIATLG